MRSESKTISLGFGDFFRSLISGSEKSEPSLNSAPSHINPIAEAGQTNEDVRVKESDQEKDKDSYQDIYSYLHLYWFI